jgi:hypothetical protein
MDKQSYGMFALLGLLLALAYLCKTIMFIIAPCVIALSFSQTGKNVKKVLFCLFIYLFVSLLFIFQISKKEGSFTFGDSGKLNYQWYVAEPGSFLKRTTDGFQINQESPVTYPFFYEPHQKTKFIFDLKNQTIAIIKNLKELFRIMCPELVPFFLIFIFIFSKNIFRRMYLIMPVLVPCFLALTLYVFVLVDGRYIGGFMTPTCITLFALLAAETFSNKAQILKFSTLLVFILLLPRFFSIGTAFKDNFLIASQPTPASKAIALLDNGLRPGDKIAYVGCDRWNQSWARLARIQIVAEMEDSDKFFKNQSSYMGSLKGLGIKALVADFRSTVPTGWQGINYNYTILLLKEDGGSV